MRRRQYAPKPAQDASVPSSAKLLQTRPFQPENDDNLQAPSVQASVQPMSSGWDLTKMEFVDEPPRSQTLGQPLQAKLTIGEPNDKYEQEADRVAKQVVQRLSLEDGGQSASGKDEPTQHNQTLQRETLLNEEDELQMKPDSLQREVESDDEKLPMKPLLQRHEGEAAASNDLESAIQQSRGGGQPLADSIREPMEQAFGGVDFGEVKVHMDAQAHQLNQSIQAKAFTTRQDIFFGEGAYQPNTGRGRQLLAHELTHVVQQSAAGTARRQVNKLQTKLTVGAAGDKYEQEADPVAKQLTQRAYAKSNLFTPISLVQRMPYTRIQRTMAGAYAALVGEGGGITHSARAKKVFTLGLGKSIYDKLLDATSDYEKEEKRGKKKTLWFHKQLNLIVTLCNAWLTDQTHRQEVQAQDKLAVSRASAIRTLLARAQNEQLSLGGGSSGEKEKNFSEGGIDFDEGGIDFFNEDSFSEKSEPEIPGKQEKMSTSSSPSVTPKYDFKHKADTPTAKQREAIFNKYVDNCRLAGLPLEEVLGIARRIITKWDGWESPYVMDFNYAYLDKFSELLQQEVKGASSKLVQACFSMNPNLEQLQVFAQELGPITTSVEDDFALDNEEEFVVAAAKQFDNKGDDLAFIKLWETADPPLRWRIYNLVSLNEKVRGLTTMGYLVEALDKKHRYDLNSLLSSWTNSDTQLDFFTWLEGQHGASTKTSVRYYNAEDRQEFVISVGAVLKRADGEALVGDNIFVLSKDQVLYAANKETTGSVRLHHSSFLSGEPVLAAGHLYTKTNGALYKIDNSSGHYGPNNYHLAQALAVLKKQGVPLEKVFVEAYKGGTQTAEEFLSDYL